MCCCSRGFSTKGRTSLPCCGCAEAGACVNIPLQCAARRGSAESRTMHIFPLHRSAQLPRPSPACPTMCKCIECSAGARCSNWTCIGVALWNSWSMEHLRVHLQLCIPLLTLLLVSKGTAAPLEPFASRKLSKLSQGSVAAMRESS